MINSTVDDKGVQKLLTDLSRKMVDMSPLMRQIAGIMHNAVEENFQQEGRPKWKPSKRAQIQGGQTFQDAASLASSISQKYTKDSAIVGTNKVYAAIHQFGGKTGSLISHMVQIKATEIVCCLCRSLHWA